ncbi:MAG TPA: DUF1987 domain-containing protein [Bacteroidales bacterium]|nr:DUF1987 domain-containing protein [Bacteroidales bacterium]
MKDLHLTPSHNTPEILLSTSRNLFVIEGKSAPEDVRSLYYPVIDWIRSLTQEIISNNPYTTENPLIFKINLSYFNSSSAKFLFDIFIHLKEIKDHNVPVLVEWYYEDEDTDMLEAGEDLASTTGNKFVFISKPS